jgi:hypothetical protein
VLWFVSMLMLMLMLLGFVLPELHVLGFDYSHRMRVGRYKGCGGPFSRSLASQRMRPPVDVTEKTAWSNGTLRATRQLDLERNTADAIVLAMTSSAKLCLSQTAKSCYPGFGANCD